MECCLIAWKKWILPLCKLVGVLASKQAQLGEREKRGRNIMRGMGGKGEGFCLCRAFGVKFVFSPKDCYFTYQID